MGKLRAVLPALIGAALLLAGAGWGLSELQYHVYSGRRRDVSSPRPD